MRLCAFQIHGMRLQLPPHITAHHYSNAEDQNAKNVFMRKIKCASRGVVGPPPPVDMDVPQICKDNC